ncbi:MAG: lysophospholipid acyltransferase family protein [Muribaculaceae bacterium]|nr:lysophospholipid acyltransferase family protein [Muribaculaceae bacterium]
MLRRWLNHIAFHLLHVLWQLLSLLPLRVHYVFSDLLYVLVGPVLHYRRRVIRRNLAAAFPELDERERRDIERGFYHHFCDVVAESVKLATISRKNIARRMVFHGAEQVNEAVRQGQSVALLLGHYGNWEWVTSLRLAMDDPDAAYGHIYHPLENPVVDRLFLAVRNRMGSHSIAMRDTLRFIHQANAQQRPSVIGYISDQVPLWQNIHHWLTFFNQETPVFTGVERIARKYNQAVFYVDVRRVGRGHYEAEFQLITRDPAAMPDHAITDEYFRRLEATIRRAPQYWLWSHNRWKRTREEFDRNYEVVGGRVVPRKRTE